MNEYLVFLTEPASNDLEEIFCYIAFVLMEPETAEGQIRRIEEQISKLSYFPGKHPLFPGEPWHSMGIRKIPIDNYIIFYITDPEERTVHVTRILYSGRNTDTVKFC